MKTREFMVVNTANLLDNPSLLLESDGRVFYIAIIGAEGRQLELNKEKVDFPPHQVVFIAPHCLLGVGDDVRDMQLIWFSRVFFARNDREQAFLQDSRLFFEASYKSYPLDIKFRPHISYMIEVLYIAYERRHDPHYRSLAHNMIEHILIQYTIVLKDVHPTEFIEDSDHVLVSRFKQLILSGEQKTRNVSDYAKKLNVTTQRLSKATNHVLGNSPKMVLTEFVVEEFKKQLLYSDMTIKEIAIRYGFLDANNFSSFFFKETGMRPSEFRSVKRKSILG